MLLAPLAVVLLLCPAASRADVYNITFYNVTFTATCIGGGTCTELINGSGFYDPIANTATGSLQLTGTLNASLIYGTPPQCTAPGCLAAPVLYDPNALPGYNPIEFFAALPTFDAPTPQPLAGGPSGALLFVPGMCGGDQPACNTTGAFPGNGATDYLLASGTYTSVDITTPEPTSLILLATGAGTLGLTHTPQTPLIAFGVCRWQVKSASCCFSCCHSRRESAFAGCRVPIHAALLRHGWEGNNPSQPQHTIVDFPQPALDTPVTLKSVRNKSPARCRTVHFIDLKWT